MSVFKVSSRLITVVMPVYNSMRYVRDSISSILEQSYPQFELIIVDDLSADGTFSIIRDLLGSDQRIKIIRLRKNSGPAVARNQAIEAAQGRYIAFCDSDDIWMPDKLEKQIATLQSSDAAVCFTTYYKMLEDGTRTERLVRAKPVVTYQMELRSNHIGLSTAIYDTEKCGKVFMLDSRKHEDYSLWLKILGTGHTAIGLQEPLVYYRLRSNSVSSNKFKASYYHWKVLRATAKPNLFYALFLFAHYAWRGLRKHKI
jgi:teichuronic acid biosynthesis glycosyltransferase TuaG